jgi:tRNA 2-thiouridine synthesizing protein B
MLHTINKSPFEKNSLETCLAHAKKGSAILLIEDGVYGALKGTAVSKMVQEAMERVTFYALASDLKTRGVADKVMDGVKLVDYSGFVDLACENDKVQAWL